MSTQLEQEVRLAAALVPHEDCTRLRAQIDRVRTLDLDGRYLRMLRLLELVLAARRRDLAGIDSARDELGNLSSAEAESLLSWLHSVPEGSSPAFRAWLGGFVRSLDSVSRSTITADARSWAIGGALAASLALVAMWMFLSRGSTAVPAEPGADAVVAAKELLGNIDTGDIGAVLASLPEPTKRALEEAWTRLRVRIGPAPLEERRRLDEMLVQVLETQQVFVKNSTLPWSRRFSGADSAVQIRELAAYLRSRAGSDLYSARWIASASLQEFLRAVAADRTERAWRSGDRSAVLESAAWDACLGIGGVSPFELLDGNVSFDLARENVVELRLSGEVVAELRMAVVDGRWIPAAAVSEANLRDLHDIGLQIPQTDRGRAVQEWLYDFIDISALRHRLEALGRALRAQSQQHFDEAMKEAQDH